MSHPSSNTALLGTRETTADGLAHALHDLRTPLNQIIGFSEMIVETAEQEDRPDLAVELSAVRDSGLQINQLLGDNNRLTLAKTAPSGTLPIFDAVQIPLGKIQSFLDRALAGPDDLDVENYRSDLQKIRLATIHFFTQVHTCHVFIREEAPQKPTGVVSAGPARGATHAPISGRILIVDDEILSREILCRRLLREGCEPIAVRGGAEALAILESETFDAVLLDIIMPEISGIQVLQHIKESARIRDLPVIMLSALTDVDQAARCIELGAEDYLPKPVNAVLLQARLGACLEKKRLRDQEQAHFRALHSEKERLSVTLRSLADAVISTDAAGKIVLFNNVASAMTGLSAEEAIGQPFDKVFPILQRNGNTPAPNAALQALSTNSVLESPPGLYLITPDGSERLISTRSAPIHDQEGKVAGTVVVLRDITDREKMADELLRASKLQSIGVLAGGLAHDFNNMLTAVLGNLSLVRCRTDLPPEIIPLTSEAERGALRAKELTQYLLTFAEGGAPMKQSLQLRNLIEETSAFVVRGSHIQCEVDLAPDLWKTEADPNQIVQVISNIIINAVQASPDGGNIRVCAQNLTLLPSTVGSLPGGDYVRICTEDWGQGIEAEHLPRIYDPFFTTKKQARGLGLAAAYSIIQRHDGHIEVESTSGSGTKVCFYLPALSDAPDDIAAPSPIPTTTLPTAPTLTPGMTPPTPAHGTRKKRVLVMDDEESIRMLASTMLEMLGYEVTTAPDGAEAVAAHATAQDTGAPFDFVVMDLTIPGGMGGKDAIRIIREKDSAIKAIVSSGYSNDPVMASYQDYGFNGVLPKPYLFSNLASLLVQLQ